MPSSFSSLSRRRALATSALLATLGMVYRRKALAAGGALNILNCNVAWSTGLEGPVAEAYKAKTDTSITAEPTPYNSLYQKILIELSQGSDNLRSGDIGSAVDAPADQQWLGGQLEEIKASDPSCPRCSTRVWLLNRYSTPGSAIGTMAADVDVDAGVHLPQGSLREGKHRESAEQLGGILAAAKKLHTSERRASCFSVAARTPSPRATFIRG